MNQELSLVRVGESLGLSRREDVKEFTMRHGGIRNLVVDKVGGDQFIDDREVVQIPGALIKAAKDGFVVHACFSSALRSCAHR
jgi:hypothetical protein